MGLKGLDRQAVLRRFVGGPGFLVFVAGYEYTTGWRMVPFVKFDLVAVVVAVAVRTSTLLANGPRGERKQLTAAAW